MKRAKVKAKAYPRIEALGARSYEHKGVEYNSPPCVTIVFAPPPADSWQLRGAAEVLFTLRDDGTLGGQFLSSTGCTGFGDGFGFSGYRLAERLAEILAPIGWRKPPRQILAEPDDAAPGHELLEAA